MKALLLTLLAAATLTLSACAGGPYEASYSYQSYQPAHRSYYQSNRSYRPAQRPFYQSNRSYCDGYQSYTVGPQYRRAYDSGWGQPRYRNYSDAPVIVNRPGGNIVVPRSWN